MAAVSQPGSRGGLITALVVFVVLFFIAAIFAVVKGIDDKDKEQKLVRLTKLYQEAITEGEMSGPDYKDVAAVRNQPEYRSRTVFDILISQRNALTTKLVGQSMGGAEALEAASQVIQTANDRLKAVGVPVPGTSLAGAIGVLTEAVLQQQAGATQLKGQLASNTNQMKKQVDNYQAEMTEHKKNVEAAKTEATTASAQTAAYRQSKDELLAKLEKNLVDTVEKARKADDDAKSQMGVKDGDVKKLQTEVRTLVAKMDRYRPQNLADSIIRRADGKVTQVGRNDVAYIDIGLGQQITPGMTFQIYDRELGIPKTTNTAADDLPQGKGSLEVTRVGARSSECRVVKLQQGQQIVEGDLIANLIYDPNVKLKFKVYGDFDIDQNSVATAAEAEIVKRLIAQWGGALVEEVTIDTDFVVMGKEPTIPQYTSDQLKDDPIAAFQMEKATKAMAAYEEIRTKALDMHVPVLNQNRFLYLIGFFDLARK
jgi:hypothetical protein